MKASLCGHIGTVRTLLEAKADPNITDEVNLLWLFVQQLLLSLQDGQTALFYAASRGHTDTVKMLVDYGAAVDFRDKVGNLGHSSIPCKWSMRIVM